MIKVTDGNIPKAEDNSILVVEPYNGTPTPANRLPQGVYYSFKGLWRNMWDKFVGSAQQLIDASLAKYVPTVTWGGITGTLSNQTDLQNELNSKVDNDRLYKNGMSSGLISGGSLSINSNPAKFDVASGFGVIVDNWTDPLNPVVYEVTWDNFSAQTLTYLATSTFTHIYIDKDGAIYQSDVFSNGELRREYIHLGRINHTNNTTIGSITDSPDLYVSPINQLRDFEEAIGAIGKGNVVTANGANLSINVSDGTMYLNGVNYDTNPKNPSFIQFSNLTAPTFRYRTQTGSGANATTIDPTKYDNAGTITSIGSTKSTNQRVYRTANGNIVVQYGQTIYNSLADAIAAIPSETFVVYPNLQEYAVLIAIISIQTNCTSLLDTTRSRITIPFAIGGGAGTSSQDLSQVLATGNTTGGTDIFVSSGDDITLDGQTASRVAIIDASKNIISADTTTYPSLTELSYVKGVTSSIQTQINNLSTLSGRLSKVYYFEDFTGGVFNQTANYSSPHGTAFLSLGTGARINTLLSASMFTDAYGVLQTETQTSTNASGIIGAVDMGVRPGSGAIVYEARVRIETLSDGTNRYDVIAGIGTRSSYLGINQILFRYSDNINGGRWQLYRDNNSATATFDSGITVNVNTWYKLRIEVNAAGTTATFFIDGVNVGSLGTLPTAGLGAYYGWRKTAGSTNRSTYIDYMYCEQTLSVSR